MGGGRSAELRVPFTPSTGSCTSFLPLVGVSFSSVGAGLLSIEFRPISCDPRGDEISLANSFVVGLGRSMLSIELRLGASKLWRGLPCVDMEARPADLAARALASLSWSRSLVRTVEAALEGPASNSSCQEQHVPRHFEVQQDIPGLCLAGDAGAAGWAAGFASFCCAVPSSSARMLSKRASTPATAWDRKEPHRFGAAIAW